MKGKAIIPLVAGLAIGIFAVKLAVDTIRKAQAEGAKTGIVNVVRATRDISSYEKLTPDMLEVIETEENMFISQDERFETVDDLVGRVTSKAISMDSPILKSMLAPEGTPPGMVGRIPDGYRAVSVQISEVTAVAYQIQPGDWVDVIVVMDVVNSLGQRKTIAEPILERVQVAAIGDTTAKSSGPNASKTRPARSVTLFVLEEDVPKLHLAATQGKITLAMRGDDQSKGGMKTANMTDLTPDAEPKPLNPPNLMKSFVDAQASKKQADVPPPVTEEPPPPFTVTVYHTLHGDGIARSIEHLVFENSQSPNLMDVQFGPQPSRMAPRQSRSRPVSTKPTTAPSESESHPNNEEGAGDS